jgi:hypothetical protein
MTSSGERQPIRRTERACKLCGQPVHARDDKRGQIHFTRRSNHDLCGRCWRTAVVNANAG